MSVRSCLLATFVLLGLLALLPISSAEAAQYPNVATLEPFSPECNYMSRAGYLRWMTFQEQDVWLSMAEAQRIVKEQLSR
jgi:hypothetical protein